MRRRDGGHCYRYVFSSAVGPTYKRNLDSYVTIKETRDQMVAWLQELRRTEEAVGLAIGAKGTLELAVIGTTNGEFS
ncbi:hypothetical protein CF319_g2677 [Tilletia indica]|nr:hypothetical protein CF319_g2677 [Tilletia indica]